jgi:flagellar protein FlaF
MRHGAQAYGQVARQIANPRELEASLLLKAASQLQAISDAWDRRNGDLNAALLYNRKLWTVFMSSAMRADNPLPIEVRRNVANLGMFVINQTMSLISDPRPQRLGSLININRELAAGLMGR